MNTAEAIAPAGAPTGLSTLTATTAFQSSPGALREVSLSMREAAETAPQHLQLRGQINQKTYLIDGEIRQWTGATQEVVSPIAVNGSTKNVIGSFPEQTAKEGLEAVAAAAKAFDRGLGTWPQMNAEQRIASVEKFIDLLQERRGEIVKRIVWEIAKTVPDAEKEFDRTIDYIKDSIKALRKIEAEDKTVKTFGQLKSLIERTPLGVTLCMGPYNYPFNETFTTLLPALLMGNTIVMKPPRIGVVLFEPVLEAFQQAFPKGVVNVVYGDGREVVTPMMKSGLVTTLAFIGTQGAADAISSNHPQPHRLVKVLGLGAKNPAVVFEDADLRTTINKAISGSLSYNGQRCTALKIHFVDERIADDYVGLMASAVKDLKQGNPWEPGVKITPLAECQKKIAYLQELVADAVAKGARVMNKDGGKVTDNIYTPAVLYPVNASMRIYHEEQFGPVIPIVPMQSARQVLDYMADSSFGQQVSVFGKEQGQLDDFARQASRLVGRVNFNDECKRGPDDLPFSGRKSSAMGTLSVEAALKIFSMECVLAR